MVTLGTIHTRIPASQASVAHLGRAAYARAHHGISHSPPRIPMHCSAHGHVDPPHAHPPCIPRRPHTNARAHGCVRSILPSPPRRRKMLRRHPQLDFLEGPRRKKYKYGALAFIPKYQVHNIAALEALLKTMYEGKHENGSERGMKLDHLKVRRPPPPYLHMRVHLTTCANTIDSTPHASPLLSFPGASCSGCWCTWHGTQSCHELTPKMGLAGGGGGGGGGGASNCFWFLQQSYNGVLNDIKLLQHQKKAVIIPFTGSKKEKPGTCARA